MAKEMRDLLIEGSHHLCQLAMGKGRKFHPAQQFIDGLVKLCDHIEKLEERIAELEKGK